MRLFFQVWSMCFPDTFLLTSNTHLDYMSFPCILGHTCICWGQHTLRACSRAHIGLVKHSPLKFQWFGNDGLQSNHTFLLCRQGFLIETAMSHMHFGLGKNLSWKKMMIVSTLCFKAVNIDSLSYMFAHSNVIILLDMKWIVFGNVCFEYDSSSLRNVFILKISLIDYKAVYGLFLPSQCPLLFFFQP